MDAVGDMAHSHLAPDYLASSGRWAGEPV